MIAKIIGFIPVAVVSGFTAIGLWMIYQIVQFHSAFPNGASL